MENKYWVGRPALDCVVLPRWTLAENITDQNFFYQYDTLKHLLYVYILRKIWDFIRFTDWLINLY